MANQELAPGRKRPDRAEALSVHTEPGDNRKYLEHSLKMWDWPRVELTDNAGIRQRVVDYFTLCAEDDMKPSVAGMALAFGMDRRRLWEVVNNCGQMHGKASREVQDTVKKAYQLLNAQMENYMQNGKINPVAGIFLMKNNMGYQDKQEVVLTPNSQLGDQTPPEELQQKYLEAAASDYDEGE